VELIYEHGVYFPKKREQYEQTAIQPAQLNHFKDSIQKLQHISVLDK